ncbi:hypothetical protein Salat_2095200 [Sesamum alatum]|uniref:Uncharacterized protein n=1 Tax=Sesamum alatum TaxID=300844 RepID=A0AAE2CGK1_9LAMI|nr:hypothetical protein Salat_2095200 [Sesamum alatum]
MSSSHGQAIFGDFAKLDQVSSFPPLSKQLNTPAPPPHLVAPHSLDSITSHQLTPNSDPNSAPALKERIVSPLFANSPDHGDLKLPGYNRTNEQVVARSWTRFGGSGLATQVESCQHSLSTWSRTGFRRDKHRVFVLEARLNRLLQGQITREAREEISSVWEELE